MVKVLLEYDARVDIQDGVSDVLDHVELNRFCVHLTMYPWYCKDGATALVRASRAGHAEVVKLLQWG